MPYYAAQLASNTDTGPAVNLWSALDSALVNVGFVKVTANLTVNVMVHNVYKSPAANNQVGKDWFIDLGWDNGQSNGNLAMTIFEVWNVGATNTANIFATTDASPLANGVTHFPANTLSGNTGSTSPVPSSSNLSYCVANVNPTSGNCASNIGYFITATIDRIIWGYANTANNDGRGQAFYIGTFDSFLPASVDPMPLACLNLCSAGFGTQGTSSTPGFGTRELVGYISGLSSAAAFGLQAAIIAPYNSMANNTVSPFTDCYLGSIPVSRCPVYGPSNSLFSNGIGGIRGLLKDFIIARDVNTPSVKGDLLNITLGGITYTYTMITGGPTTSSNTYFSSGTALGIQGWMLQT